MSEAKATPPPTEAHPSDQVAADAAAQAEKIASDLERKASIARNSAIYARKCANEARTSHQAGITDHARFWAKQALEEAQAAADAASLII